MSKRECVRCGAMNKNGSQCKRTTCIYSKFCGAHTKQLFDLQLKRSGLPKSGKGLFTSKDIPKNTKIAQYTGKIMTQAQHDKKPSGYAVAISKNRVIDARSTQSTLARYANDCRPTNKVLKQCKGNNAKLKRGRGDTVRLTSIKKIPAGSEIFTSYGGKAYWGDAD